MSPILPHSPATAGSAVTFPAGPAPAHPTADLTHSAEPTAPDSITGAAGSVDPTEPAFMVGDRVLVNADRAELERLREDFPAATAMITLLNGLLKASHEENAIWRTGPAYCCHCSKFLKDNVREHIEVCEKNPLVQERDTLRAELDRAQRANQAQVDRAEKAERERDAAYALLWAHKDRYEGYDEWHARRDALLAQISEDLHSATAPVRNMGVDFPPPEYDPADVAINQPAWVPKVGEVCEALEKGAWHKCQISHADGPWIGINFLDLHYFSYRSKGDLRPLPAPEPERKSCGCRGGVIIHDLDCKHNAPAAQPEPSPEDDIEQARRQVG